MAIISFENLVEAGSTFALVPDGYRHLDWDFVAVDVTKNLVPWFKSAVHSGEGVAYYDQSRGPTADFKSPDRDDDFDFNSGYFTAFNANDLKVKVFGYDDGERVAKKVFLLDPDQEFVRFGPQFDDIDEIIIKATGGTLDDVTEGSLEHTFAVDDLFIDF